MKMADEMQSTLRVLTLNCWGIPYVSKMWEERKILIAEELAKGCYDVVALQEVYDSRCYELWSFSKVSGVIGSGVCVLSRYPIVDAFTYRYSLNGYMYNITHGDWFGGKAVGYCVIDHPKQQIHFFATHMHAEYGESHQYVSHRLVQSYQLSQFIQHLTQPTDTVIVCGDMNCKPSELCYRIIKDVTGLVDAWGKHGQVKSGCYGNTADVSQNTFSGGNSLVKGGPNDGNRIDYIFYRCAEDSLKCVECEVTMRLVPGKKFSFSDHEGVSAKFVVNDLPGTDKRDGVQGAVPETHRIQEVLAASHKVISTALDALASPQYMQIFIACIMLFFVISPILFPVSKDSPLSLHCTLGKFLYLIRMIITVILSGFLFYLIFNSREEYSVYKGVLQMIDLHLKRISLSVKKNLHLE
ncbi:putative neutral sphingomyelinase isoform X2 [Montipora foliosa]|uniref:putative neutral sphingomyelinase isoform X2 n=1 Tax=Montipora foliosa TaxID=591990 RepID=UPI0035F15159